MRSIGIRGGAWIAAAMMMMPAAPIGFAGDRAAGPAEVQRLPRPYGLDISCASNHVMGSSTISSGDASSSICRSTN
jgi:hypothetical protein